ncbi:MAG: serine/threonine protein kinase, partial [Deltaproteobacteria bacterium]|nr:serine/threonine protein kinase [Deltaproteobacteria bacterium]
MVDPGGSGDESQDGLSPGLRLGKYEIVRLLGAGGMGAVYEAAHTEIGKRVAIKVLSPAIAAVPGARARFLREAQLTSRVRHPNIVDVTDMGSDMGQTYLVMEFLHGEDLAQRIGRTGPLPAQQLADIMLPVCSAVVEAHKAGITHRDLKPQNIFLAVGPHTTQPKVLDFGISKGNDVAGVGALTGTGAMIGTPFYLAPEQIMDTRSAGPNSDQYALGVIMYECLTGHRPFEAENLFVVFQAIVAGQPVLPTQRRPGIPAALEAIVLRAMHVAPGARFPSTLALGHALLPFASGKMQSIWEEAFAGGEKEVTLGSTVHASAPVMGAVPIDVATPSPLTGRGQPLVTPPPLAATPGARVRGPVAWTVNPFATNESALDLRPRSSRARKVLVAAVGVLLLGGAGMAVRQSRMQSADSAAAMTAVVATPIPASAAPTPTTGAMPPGEPTPAATGAPAAILDPASATGSTSAATAAPGLADKPIGSRSLRVSVKV